MKCGCRLPWNNGSDLMQHFLFCPLEAKGVLSLQRQYPRGSEDTVPSDRNPLLPPARVSEFAALLFVVEIFKVDEHV